MQTYGAGILFKSGNEILLVKRADTGEWAVPGGLIEPNETPQDAARREVREEIRVNYTGAMRPFTLIDGYITYLADKSPLFKPRLNDENTEWGWFTADSLPRPLHPGLIATLQASPLNEKEVADLISVGRLTSPQHFINMWLFAIRVTGTGIAFRSVDNQFTFRSPEDYLNEEFLERCAGVPLIWMHPEKQKLDSDEFAERIIGTLSKGWITDDREVWAMARVYDADAAELMRTNQLSTSPTVTYSDAQDTTVTVDGDSVLVEDEPLLLDHVAVCEAGVWDKLLDPYGIITNEFVEVDNMKKGELRELILDVLADSQSKADYYISKAPDLDRLADGCGGRSKSDGDYKDMKKQSEASREREAEGMRKAMRRKDHSDGAYEQNFKDREDESRGMRGKDYAHSDWSEDEELREKQRRGMDAYWHDDEEKYHQTEADKRREAEAMRGKHWKDDDAGWKRQDAADRRREREGEEHRRSKSDWHESPALREEQSLAMTGHTYADESKETARRHEREGEEHRRSKSDWHESEATRRKQHDAMEGRRWKDDEDSADWKKQSEASRERESRATKGKHWKDDADYDQTELDREHERVAEERYWREHGKADKEWESTAKDRRDESRGERRAHSDKEWHATEKDRRDMRRGEEHRSHADSSYLRREIEDIRRRLPDELSDRERDAVSDAQMKADSVFAARGLRAPTPQAGETSRQYRRRVLQKLQSASPDYRHVDLTSISDANLLAIAEKQIFADAVAFADDGVQDGHLREVRNTDMTGRVITSFIGDPAAAWAPFKLGKRNLIRINTPSR